MEKFVAVCISFGDIVGVGWELFGMLLDLFQFVRLMGKLPGFLCWRFESLLVNAEKYCWRNMLQFAFHLVILLELAEGCLECWLGLFQLVGLLGKLPVFLGWRFESSLVNVEKYG